MKQPFSLRQPLIRMLVLGIGMTAIVVLLLLELAGTFHPKIDTRGYLSPAGLNTGPDLPSAAGKKLEPVRRIKIPATETAVGSIRAVHEIALASKLLAKIMQVNVKAGSPVKQGEVLIRLDDADLTARLRQAEASVENARAMRDRSRIEFERIQKLHEQGNAAKVEFDRSTAEYKSAEAEFQRAEQARNEAATTLEYATLTAPINGTVIDKKVDVGDMVTPGQVLLTLYDPTRMQLVARVRESLTRHLTVGQAIGVHVEALGKTCQGQVSEIVPEADVASRTFSVKVTGPCPSGLYSGMFGRLIIPLDEQQVLVVPRTAIRHVGQLDLVEVAEAGSLRRRTVLLGQPLDLPNEAYLQVLSGLREGEQVVVEDSAPRTHEGTP